MEVRTKQYPATAEEVKFVKLISPTSLGWRNHTKEVESFDADGILASAPDDVVAFVFLTRYSFQIEIDGEMTQVWSEEITREPLRYFFINIDKIYKREGARRSLLAAIGPVMDRRGTDHAVSFEKPNKYRFLGCDPTVDQFLFRER